MIYPMILFTGTLSDFKITGLLDL